MKLNDYGVLTVIEYADKMEVFVNYTIEDLSLILVNMPSDNEVKEIAERLFKYKEKGK